MRTVHGKLVRDNIPEIIVKNGGKCETRLISGGELEDELRRKLLEEVNEFLASESPEDVVEEIGDVIEVLYALLELKGAAIDEMHAVRRKKAEKNGAFAKGIYLEHVDKH